MLSIGKILVAGLMAALVLPQTACLGGGGDGALSSGALQVQVSPSNLSVPAGGGGFLTVTTTRPVLAFLGVQGPLVLSLDQAPAGVTGSGSIAVDASSGTLSLWVDASVAPQAIQGLRVKATGGNVVAEAAFTLTIAPALAPGQLRADLVQASGGFQQGGGRVNTPVVQEPVAATPSTDGAQILVVRHGFLPAVPSN